MLESDVKVSVHILNQYQCMNSLSPRSIHLQSHPLVTVLMEMFVWWEAQTSMKVEWRCASTTSGEQYVMTPGTPLMLLLSADNWDMYTMKVSLVSNDAVAECALLTNSNPLAFTDAFFGAGTGPIFLDDVQCSSSSSQLLECFSSPILTHNCQHFEDAGVGCEGKFSAMCGNSITQAADVLSLVLAENVAT